MHSAHSMTLSRYCILLTMFLSKSDAVKSVWQAFENCHCVIAVYYVFYSTVYNLSRSVFLPCWQINVFITN